MADKLLNVCEVSTLLGVSKASVWRWAAAGTIPKPIKLGHCTRWSSIDIADAVNRLRETRDVEAGA
jgi:predicted DNA-binding transcriptional regulator AlpA